MTYWPPEAQRLRGELLESLLGFDSRLAALSRLEPLDDSGIDSDDGEAVFRLLLAAATQALGEVHEKQRELTAFAETLAKPSIRKSVRRFAEYDGGGSDGSAEDSSPAAPAVAARPRGAVLASKLRTATVTARQVLSEKNRTARRRLLFEDSIPSLVHAGGPEEEEAVHAAKLRARARAQAARGAASGARQDAEHEAARQVTDSMRSIRQRMAAEVEQSSATIEALSKDSAMIASTSSQHDTLSSSIKRGSGLLSHLKQRDRTDRLLVGLGFSFFCLTILYIVKARLGIRLFG